MNLLLFNYTLSVQSVYLCLQFYFLLYTANTALVYTNALHIQYFKIITGLCSQLPKQHKKRSGFIIDDTAIFIYLAI